MYPDREFLLFIFHLIDTSLVVQSIYSSELTAGSHMYCRDRQGVSYYYEAIQVNVVTSGCYTLRSISTVNTYGYLYKHNFNPFNSSENLLSKDHHSGDDGQFKLARYLENRTKYILVVTTYYENVRGKFSIFVSGSNNVSLNRFSEYMYCLLNNQHGHRKYRQL